MSAQASIFCTVSLKIILLKCLLHLIGPNEFEFTKKAKFLAIQDQELELFIEDNKYLELQI